MAWLVTFFFNVFIMQISYNLKHLTKKAVKSEIISKVNSSSNRANLLWLVDLAFLQVNQQLC